MAYKRREVENQVDAIRRGIACVLPERLLVLKTWEELRAAVCGTAKISVRLLKRVAKVEGFAANAPPVVYLWKVLGDFPDPLREAFVRFTWGRSRIPLREADFPDHKFCISRMAVSGNPDAYVPRAHTCFFHLELPAYSSPAVCRRQLLRAMVMCGPEILPERIARDVLGDEISDFGLS